jgi:hypothetical protein
MQLEQIMQSKGVPIPFDEDGADRPLNNDYDGNGNTGDRARKYTPYEQLHLGDDDNDDVPLQLLTADEKVDEL